MTIDELQQRVITISNEMTLVKAHYAKLEGHLEEAQYWLTENTKIACESPNASEEKLDGEANNEGEGETPQE